jgi:hypothetical protein
MGHSAAAAHRGYVHATGRAAAEAMDKLGELIAA